MKKEKEIPKCLPDDHYFEEMNTIRGTLMNAYAKFLVLEDKYSIPFDFKYMLNEINAVTMRIKQ